MTKAFPFFLLLANILIFPLQAGAAETTSGFKTGEYRICRGTEAECLQGKGEVGNVYVRFEKNGGGYFSSKHDTNPFLWREEGGAILIDASDEDRKPSTLEITAGSALLRESDEVSYLLIEDEDTVFRPGMYFRCPDDAEASCLKAVDAFLDTLPFDAEEESPDYLSFRETGSKVFYCPKGKPDCDELVWKRADSGGELEVAKDSGEVVLRFTEDRNMLVDKSSGARYLRAASEAVMNGAN